jgi:fibrillarin-like rRNA methylase
MVGYTVDINKLYINPAPQRVPLKSSANVLDLGAATGTTSSAKSS